jgi:hypothetical protein
VSQGEWRYAFASVIGTSHLNKGTPCQDASICELLQGIQDGEILCAIAADGAGSALYAEAGARLACDNVLESAKTFVRENGSVKNLSKEIVISWIKDFIKKVEARAEAQGATIKEFACTLLLAIIGPEHAVFAQIGDGAIVIDNDEMEGGYDWVFWPDKGEYENETIFSTDKAALEKLQFENHEHRFNELFLFTDGIQRLVLHYATKSVHNPFFQQIASRLALESTGRLRGIEIALEKYLSSPQVNNKTNDDKTLIIATKAFPKKPQPQMKPIQSSNADHNREIDSSTTVH